jgi:transposase-like protein
MAKGTQYLREVRERAVRLVFDHADEYDSQWAAIQSIAQNLGCSAESMTAGRKLKSKCRHSRNAASDELGAVHSNTVSNSIAQRQRLHDRPINQRPRVYSLWRMSFLTQATKHAAPPARESRNTK